MQIGSLDLPDEVLTALEEKRLVIFAGAGVSIPPPASLPSFQSMIEGLVKRELSPDELGQMDRVLGRAKEEGIPVHRLAAEALSRQASHFNALHENLVALFGSAAAVRIVTTNFDLHFEGAIEARPDLTGVEVYTAPALPVGSSFTGLVHLHGALGRRSEELVLTDADFGRAYLTEGWAGRFVVDLFREYTVLFVGYSYSDTVMSYLTRGLAPTFGRKRFALTEIGQREKWKLLGIQPIDYDPADGHRALAEGLSQWVSFERRGFLDWGQRLPALVDREPRALAPDEQGELEFCLKNEKRARLFYQHATDPSWLEWAEACGRLQPLFSYEGNQESLRDLALWFTEDPLGLRGKVALQIALKRILPVGRALATLASQQVYSALAELRVVETPHAQRAAAWATLLIERRAPNTSPGNLGDWLNYLSPQDHSQLAIQILAHLVRCQPLFREGTLWDRERELGLSLETPSLTDFSYRWSKLREHIGVLAWPLVPVLTEVFESRWRWQVTLEASTPRSDPWGWDRPWVERPPGEGSLHKAIHDRSAGPLLEIAKDILDQLLARDPDKGTALIELWLAASAPQLVQLGLYGLAMSSQWKPVKKLERLVAQHLPAKMPFKVEAFRVLRESYPQLSPRQRERFLKRAERLYRQEIDERQEEPDRRRNAVYEWFNFLVWLERVAPGDPLLDCAIATIHQSYPEFQPRDHPELDIVHGEVGWVRPVSALTSQEIARLSLPEWLVEMAAASKRQEGFKDHVKGFLEETARAAREDLEWGLTFARGLLENGQVDHQVWEELLNAWGDRAFKPGEWKRVLSVLDHPQLLAAQTWGVTNVVRGRAKQKDPKATEAMLRSSLRLAEKLLPLAESISFSLLSENVDWLSQAINHPGGQLAEFLIPSIGELLGPNPQRGCGVPQPCRRLLNAMANGTGRASAMARVVLAIHVHYFLWIDPDWTRDRLLPLFDWNRDALQAVQAWHGFLAWGRPGAALLEALTTAAVQLASHLEELGGEREHYGKFVARAAFSLPDDPLTKKWFQAFLTKGNDDDRAHFAWGLDELLASLSPEQKAEIWRDWLNRYLERRAQLPPPPEGKELTALMDWSFNLPGQLADLVERLEALPGGGAAVDTLLWKFQEGELAGSDPNLLARLLLSLLKRCEKIEPWELSQLRASIKRMIEEGARENLIRELVEKYLEHGGLEHQELVNLLEGRESKLIQ
ncbi:MAG TPA: SIR2 family protein [Thermoanaerobaculia bacterium]|jgi:hypothetical protein|nr:SIR2 family protein [Thermoanaerobaculia bacterium]